ncbi:uncharacterized protein LOC129584116 [Paramacrobiotus metropolitanus]|uniref:uncharacterized protein LOC129584116 n=1 Tax=Paramacrobiotus metropolitanus TaxID=2943436 RepID=UPI002445A232|nr:uncharacterized protein LOC129584116 [Paramacrobiotus metropolitanus]
MEHFKKRYFLVLVGILAVVTGTAPDMHAYPQFDGRQMTKLECTNRPRNRCFDDGTCLYGSILQQIVRKVEQTVVFLECQNNASVQEFLDTASNIAANSPNRAVVLHLTGKITNQTFANIVDPIRNQVTELIFDDSESRREKHATSKIGALPLMYLLYLKFANARDLVIQKRDFLNFAYLRRLEFYLSLIASVERDTFTSLPLLRSFQLESGMEDRLGYPSDEVIITTESLACRDPDSFYLNPLRCNCTYVWLRNWLKANPHLLKERAEGELYIIGNHLSAKARKQPVILAAIGCS